MAPALLACRTQVDVSSAEGRLPPTMVWAWRRPENLSFIDVSRTGVAHLKGTLFLRGSDHRFEPNLNPLRAPERAVVLPTLRVEVKPDDPPSLCEAQRRRLVAEAVRAGRGRHVAGVQIDFEAGVSQRDFYRRALEEIRAELGNSRFVSITALASWCLDDPWIRGLPVDEAVPMLYAMGKDGDRILRSLDGGRGFSVPLCRSVGVNVEGPRCRPPASARLYWFSQQPWTEARWRDRWSR